MAAVTSNDAVEFFNFMLTRVGVNDNTANGRLSKVRQMVNNAMERDIITRNPFKLSSHLVSVGVAK